MTESKGGTFDIMSYLKYFITIKGLFRTITACYFAFFFLLSAILSGTLGIYSINVSLHQSAIGFISFLAFWIPIGEFVMGVVDVLDLSILKPYTFYILLGETIGHGVAAVLLFIPTISLSAYAGTVAACTSAECRNIVGIEGSAAFFGFVGIIVLCVTTGVFIFLLITRSGTKSSADPV